MNAFEVKNKQPSQFSKFWQNIVTKVKGTDQKIIPPILQIKLENYSNEHYN